MVTAADLRNYRLVLFDVDETLLDFEAAENEAIRCLWKAFFQGCVGLDEFAQEYKAINRVIWKEVEVGTILIPEVKEIRGRRVLERFNQPVEWWEKTAEVFIRGLASVAIWLPEAEDCFHRIRRSHLVGFVTNGLVDVQYPRTDTLGIRRYLSTYKISQEVGVAKPDPVIFNQAIDEVGVGRGETLYVGDSLTSDFQGAINAGIDFCWYNPAQVELPSSYPKPRFEIARLGDLG